MATKVTSVDIPLQSNEGYTIYPLIYDNLATSDLLDLGMLRLVGIIWDATNDVWGRSCSFKTATDPAALWVPVNIEDSGAYVPYETPTLEDGYNPVNAELFSGLRYIAVVAGALPGSQITGQIYLVLKA